MLGKSTVHCKWKLCSLIPGSSYLVTFQYANIDGVLKAWVISSCAVVSGVSGRHAEESRGGWCPISISFYNDCMTGSVFTRQHQHSLLCRLINICELLVRQWLPWYAYFLSTWFSWQHCTWQDFQVFLLIDSMWHLWSCGMIGESCM